MFRVKVVRSSCSRCLECERPGCMPGLITRLMGNVLIAWPRLDDFEVAAGVVGAIEACTRDAIHIEVVP